MPLRSWCAWYWEGKIYLPYVTALVFIGEPELCLICANLQTMSVLAVMRNLKSEVDAGGIRPYCFVEINGLKLASPENIYSVGGLIDFFFYAASALRTLYMIPFLWFYFQVIYEGLSGHRVGWKKALHFLNERFSDENRRGKEDTRPCILLIDELDLLVTKNQSVSFGSLGRI